MLFRIELECESEAELEVAIADGRWKPVLVETKTMGSKYIGTIQVTDPTNDQPVEVEIRLLDNGVMVGFDGSVLEQFEGDLVCPYDAETVIHVPDDEKQPTVDLVASAMGMDSSELADLKAQMEKCSPSDEASIKDSTFDDLDKIVGPSGVSSEAIVFIGCGGPLSQWTQGITEALEDILVPITWYKITTTGGRTDVVMPLPEKKVDLGKLAIWKVKFGDCSWWSDYRVNYRSQHKKG